LRRVRPRRQVTQMARQMVVNYGFSDIGPWSLLDQNAQSGDMIMRMMARNSTSESLQRKIDVAVKKIASEAYEVALNHIRRAPLPSPGRRVLATFALSWLCRLLRQLLTPNQGLWEDFWPFLQHMCTKTAWRCC